jgi:hypothetical protein
MASVTPQQLRSALDKYFNLSEIRTLCFDLSIPYEDFGGEGKKEKANELVQYAERFGKFDQVVAYVQQARPHANLQESGGGSTAVAPDKPTVQSQQTGQTSHNYNFYGPVTGSAIGEGSVQAENIAGRDIINNYNEPQNRDEFAKQLVQLEALLKEAIASGEIKDKRDAETAVEDVQDIVEEIQHSQPRANRIGRRLEEIKEIIEGASKAGAAALKAVPIISGLIKVVTNLF